MKNDNAQNIFGRSSVERIKEKINNNNMKNNEKTAVNNQWVSTGLKPFEDNRERRDGPGGEDAES